MIIMHLPLQGRVFATTAISCFLGMSNNVTVKQLLLICACTFAYLLVSSLLSFQNERNQELFRRLMYAVGWVAAEAQFTDLVGDDVLQPFLQFYF